MGVLGGAALGGGAGGSREIFSAAARQIGYFDDFLCSVASSGDEIWHSSVNGAGSGQSANSSVLAGSIGRRTITSGTASTGRANFSRGELVAGQCPLASPWLAGSIELVWRVQIPQLPAAGSEPAWSLALGAGAASNSIGWSDGIGARYSLAEGTWVLASRAGSSDVAIQASSIAPVAGSWQVILIAIADAAARMFIGSTIAQAKALGPAATVTTAGASALALAQMFKIHNTAAVAGARSMHVDFAGLCFTLNSSR